MSCKSHVMATETLGPNDDCSEGELYISELLNCQKIEYLNCKNVDDIVALVLTIHA